MIDELYQKNVHFLELKLFFSMRCIRLNTVLIQKGVPGIPPEIAMHINYPLHEAFSDIIIEISLPPSLSLSPPLTVHHPSPPCIRC